jgi:hypothetical protein
MRPCLAVVVAAEIRAPSVMGLDASSVAFLCAARSLGVDFSRTAMIGRQSFWPDVATLRRVFAVHGIDRDPEAFVRDHKFAEEFFKVLGAEEIASFDASSYENASILHDMNLPVPRALHGKFSCVHDGGTLEHVFNVPQALKNCMELVKVGGHFTQVNGANNFAGHGFWQFSPELIFRAFTPTNGYEIVAVLMHEVVPGGEWCIASDPDEIRQRVELVNNNPTYILTVAKRVAEVEIFKTPPQQSDYVVLWGRGAGSWKRHVPQTIKRSVKSLVRHVSAPEPAAGHAQFERGFNPKSYRRIEEEALLRGRLG